MAAFDLRCTTCDHEFNKIVPYSKLSEVECPECGGQKLTRIYKVSVKGPINSGGSSNNTPPTSGFT